MIIDLEHDRTAQLKRESRFAVETQYQALLQALQTDIEAKGIAVEDFPRGD